MKKRLLTDDFVQYKMTPCYWEHGVIFMGEKNESNGFDRLF